MLEYLKPERVFYYFEEICRIPHGSGNTKEISDYCINVAKGCGFECRQDKSNNVIIWKPGTKGYEKSPSVLIQGHLDMVCEKEEDCSIDFEKEGLRLCFEDGMISAEGTTLGADDGIAVAYAMALLEAEDIPHPPLEVVLTTDEETGMLGATSLDYSNLKSRIMLNLDSEEQGHLLVGCAGGVRVNLDLDLVWETDKGCLMTIVVTGLQGGHSGVEIHKGRANACKLLGRVLYELKQDFTIKIKAVNGGNKDNVIPREAEASVLVRKEDYPHIKEKLQESMQRLRNEYSNVDDDIQIKTQINNGDCGEEELKECQVMTETCMERVIAALQIVPNGVQKMSPHIEGLVQTSLNLGIIRTMQDKVSFTFALRSSAESEKVALMGQLACIANVLDGSVSEFGDYPAWEYRKESPLRDLMIEIYQEKCGEKPVVEVIHAGVECGIFAGNLPGLDCVSFGPDMKDIHTPKESLDVQSVQWTWEYLLEILKRLR